MKPRISTARLAALVYTATIALSLADDSSKPSLPAEAQRLLPPNVPAQAESTTPAPLSLWLTELVKMAKSGVEADVMLTFVGSAGTFNLAAEQIILLRDLGVPSEVITAIIRHDVDIRESGQDTPPPIRLSTAPLPLLKQKQAAPSSSAAQTTRDSTIPPGSKTPEESIIAPTLELAMGEESEADACRLLAPPAAAGNAKLSPVREPYPVKLNEPILIYRAAVPSANMMVIRRFP
jgi:hypothetical protein